MFAVRSIAVCFALIAATTSVGVAAEKSSPPNIVLIMSDDMGYSDIGCYGGQIQTPHLDSLASQGVRFTQFYNMARCCPTRASLLTGLYPHQAGVGHMTSDNRHDGYRGELNKQCVTLAEVLGTAGYTNYMCGKWHVTRNDGPDGDKSAWPLQRGFHKFYGTIKGAGSFYDPTGLCRQNTYITPENDPEYQSESYYYTDAISDNAVRYLAQHQQGAPDKPFFLYVGYTAAHWPMHAKEQDIAKYQGKFDQGYEAVRATKFERMKSMGLLAADAKLTTEPDAWSKVANKAWEARCMEVYAAMIDNMDAGIGRIVAQLKRDGQLDNTLILFLQDNGGCAEGTGRQSNAAAVSVLKPLGRDGLQTRVTPQMQTRDGRAVRTGPDVMPGPADTYVAYGRDWARVSNTPFREFKHWTHEGGISTPLIAHWPAGITAETVGKFSREPGHLIDIMATVVDVSGAAYPHEHRGQPIKPMEGKSLRPALSGSPITAAPRQIYWEHEGNRAVREGNWKLVAKEDQPWELYDIDADRTELNNLAEQHPDRVRDLSAKWDAYAARANVLPLGTWRGAKAKPAASTQHKFELKSGDKLGRAKSPAFAGASISITAKFNTENATDGVLVAQGGNTNGYVLFLAGGKLTFLIRSAGDIRSIATTETITGTHTAVARMETDGSLKLSVDGKAVANSDAGLLPKMPGEGLDVGRDTGGAVGPYKSPYEFNGKIESIVIDIE
ncbi:MAG: arylsulfatase [Planctomycetota bacterium]